jgi:hypothetical protein
MSPMADKELVLEACRAIQYKNKIGNWEDNHVPKCFITIAHKYLPRIKGNSFWIRIVESWVYDKAIDMLLEQEKQNESRSTS